MRYSGGAKRSFPVAADAQNGPVGQASFYTHIAALISYAQAAI